MLTLGLTFGIPAYAAGNDAVQVAHSYARFAEAEGQFAFLEENCVRCHNLQDWAGSLALDLMRPEEVADNMEVWEQVVLKLRGRMMPPGGEERPADGEVEAFATWMEGYLDHAAASNPHIGRVGLHRLNRKEYANAVRDLLGLEVDAATLLPLDDSVDGFDNVAQALRVSPAFLEQSLIAARVVASQAIGNPQAQPGGTTYTAAGRGPQHGHRVGLPLGTRGGLAVEHYFPADGQYLLNIGNLAQALWVFNQEFTHRLIATYNGRRFFEMDIGGGADLRAIDQLGDPAVDAINAKLKNIPFEAAAGPQVIAVTFVHRSFAEHEGRLHAMSPGGDQNIISINSFEIQGPFAIEGISATPARNQIFSCYPQAAEQEAPCAREIIASMARKAFRGPVADAEMAALLAVFDQASREQGFDLGIRRALTAILASPRFLYRLEQPDAEAEPGAMRQLSDLELASRLSFFLWSSIPDEELLVLAEAGNLQESQTLRAQVERMLRDPRAAALASNFAYQWLNMGGLDEIDPDPAIFRDMDFGVRDLFKEEITRFAADIFLNNRGATELLTSDFTWLNERLALHYGIDSVKGDQFRAVRLADPRRFGLLGKGGVLMVSSYPDRTSPVLRGAYVLEHITGTPPPLPPPTVEALVENKPGQKALTVRERLESHRDNEACVGCHEVIDALGFALEGFDAVGRSRRVDRMIGTPIDTHGVLPGDRHIGGVEDLRVALVEDPRLFVRNLTAKLMLYALGRPVEAHDMAAVRQIVRGAEASDFAFYELVQGIVASAQFRYAQSPERPEDEGMARELAAH